MANEAKATWTPAGPTATPVATEPPVLTPPSPPVAVAAEPPPPAAVAPVVPPLGANAELIAARREIAETRLAGMVGKYSPATIGKLKALLLTDDVLSVAAGSKVPELMRILAENQPVAIGGVTRAQLPDAMKAKPVNPVLESVKRRYNLK